MIHRNTYNQLYRTGIHTFRDILPKIEFVNRLKGQIEHTGEVFQNILSIIDGTECRIKRFTNWADQAIYYSNKKKIHAVKYQVCVNICSGDICHISIMWPGRAHDKRIFDNFIPFVKNEMRENEKFLGDKGYVGSNLIVTPIKGSNLLEEQLAYNYTIGAVRVLVERVIGRMKIFQCLVQKWRHPIEFHEVVFNCIGKLVNFINEFRPINSRMHPCFFV